MDGINLAEKNGMWKGNNVGNNQLHAWLKKRLPKPKFCENCKKFPPYDLANKTGIYNRELKNWEWLCRKCHITKDGRINNLLKGHKGRKKKPCQVCGKLTTRIKFCIKCAKKERKLWWKQYNQTPKRKQYLNNFRKNT